MGKGFYAALQDTLHVSDKRSVVGHGDMLFFCTAHPVFHFPFVLHTSAAVNDQAVRRQIVRKFRAGGKAKLKLFAGVVCDPPGKLDGSDIVTLTVMGAALTDQYRIMILQGIDCCDTGNHLFQNSLIARHKDGEGGKGNGGRNDLANTWLSVMTIRGFFPSSERV